MNPLIVLLCAASLAVAAVVPECGVCLDAMAKSNEVSLLCKHRFHKSCIDQWRRHGGKSCPLCRAAFPVEPTEKIIAAIIALKDEVQETVRVLPGLTGIFAGRVLTGWAEERIGYIPYDLRLHFLIRLEALVNRAGTMSLYFLSSAMVVKATIMLPRVDLPYILNRAWSPRMRRAAKFLIVGLGVVGIFASSWCLFFYSPACKHHSDRNICGFAVVNQLLWVHLFTFVTGCAMRL
jgi:Ring finger domain